METTEVPGPVRLLPRPRGERVIGRMYILAQLADEMRSDRVIQLWGDPGVGKSTLLRHAARTLQPGPDGVVFVPYVPRGAALRALLKGTRVTVYVDNADLPGEQLRELADTVGDATFVFASRKPTLRGENTVIEVPGLDYGAALELLGNQRPAATRRLWETTAGNPRLLVQAGTSAG